MINGMPRRIRGYIEDKAYSINKIGMSDSVVMIFDEYVLKIEKTSSNIEQTVKMMRWLDDVIPVPQVIDYETSDTTSYLLMTKINGKMSCDENNMNNSNDTVRVLADGLKLLWSVDITACPVDCGLEHELIALRRDVENGSVPQDAFEGTRFDSNLEMLEWLENNKPMYEPVLSHGDYCMPNIFIDNGTLGGFIDLGNMGIADKYRDIALCYKSLEQNFSGKFGNKVYSDFHSDILFEMLDITPDREKIEYYIMLDKLR